MKLNTILAVALGLVGTTNAHMKMDSPSPINHPQNPFKTNPDYDYLAPLGNAPYPCRGQLKYLDGPAGQPVATWPAGSSQTVVIGGGAAHNGGSCQFSLSYDKGESFRVLKSIIGKCPTPGVNYQFTVPSDAPNGDKVVFAWSWFNNTGNREMYMNCAVVKIIGSRGGSGFNSRPLIALANIPGHPTTPIGDFEYPNPGPDVQRGSVTTSSAPVNNNPGPAPTPVQQNNNPTPRPTPQPRPNQGGGKPASAGDVRAIFNKFGAYASDGLINDLVAWKSSGGADSVRNIFNRYGAWASDALVNDLNAWK